MSRVQNTAAVVLRMQRMTPAMERELEGTLDVCAQLVGRRQTALAPKFRSHLATSVRIDKPGPLQRDIGPTMEYAEPQEKGVKAGGKGLPRFSDPAAADIVAWLRTKAFSGRARVRPNTMAAVRANLELRDRYEGLAWHIRHKGVKPTPFILKSLQQMEPVIRVRLQASAERALQLGSATS